MDSFEDENKYSYEEHRSEGNNNERVGDSLGSASQEDDDDWSRQVETDETMGQLGHDDSLRMMESVVEENSNEEMHRVDGPQPPSQRQLSLKEKLVMRERERRIETERARLKRQFALNNAQDLVEHNADTEVDNDTIRLSADMLHQSTMETRDHGSVTDTLGEESIVAHPDEENLDEARLGFNMERFLRNSNSFDPQAKPADSKETPDQGVLMERFLNEPLMPEVSGTAMNREAHRTASFDVDGIPNETTIQQSPGSLLMPSFDEYTNASGKGNSSTFVQANQENIISRENSVDDQDHMSDVGSSTNSHIHHEPRLLRLTEADMEELAAIDEASIGNAPPSEREETFSEIGELAGFAGSHTARFAAGNMSSDTPTTAQDESVTTSLLSGIQNNNAFSELDRHSDHRSLEGLCASNIPSQLAPSPFAANPASVSVRDEDTQVYQYNSSFVHYDTDAKPGSEPHEESEEIGEIGIGQYRPDIRPTSMDASHEIDEIRIAAQGSPIPIDTDLTTGNWSPNSGMNVSPLQVRHQSQISAPRDPIPNYGSLEAGEMFSKVSEEYLAQKEAAPLLSKVPPEIMMHGGIPWRQSSEVKMTTVAVLATGIAVGLLLGIIIGATMIPLITK